MIENQLLLGFFLFENCLSHFTDSREDFGVRIKLKTKVSEPEPPGVIWLEPEPSLWPGSGSTLNIYLIIHENDMELNII